MIGTQLDRYSIVEELGHGGMSTVYRGVDTSLEREVAIKVLHDHLAKSVENRQRFHREAKAIAKLRQMNILEIYDYSSVDADKSYIVMEYVKGKNLRQWVAAHGAVPPEHVAMLALEICDALGHAHEHGVIHRDIKPENIMVSGRGEVKLMDFGIAHVIGSETMTQTGSLLGSPAHMAPEIIEGERADIRSDIFSLGTVLYWLCAGRIPFDGNNAPQVFKRVLNNEVVDLESIDPKIGSIFADLIRKCMGRLPDDRFQTIDELQRALRRFIDQTTLYDKGSLGAYFDDPVGTVQTWTDSIVPELVRCARDAYDKKDIPRAVAYFNRVLAFEPENQDVRSMMAALGRRRAVRASALAGVVAAIVCVAVIVYTNTRPEEATVEEPVIDNEPAMAVVNDSQESALQIARATESATLLSDYVVVSARQWATPTERKTEKKNGVVSSENGKVEPTETNNAVATNNRTETVARSFSYRFSVIPGAATFLVDGRPVDVLMARSGVALAEGVHRITATSPGAKPFSREIRVEGEQKNIMPIVLEWNDGRVQVISNSKAVVWVDDGAMRRIGARGQNATFMIPFGLADSTENRKEVTLRIASAQDMGHPKVHKVAVKPGQLATINVNFATPE